MESTAFVIIRSKYERRKRERSTESPFVSRITSVSLAYIAETDDAYSTFDNRLPTFKLTSNVVIMNPANITNIIDGGTSGV